WFAKLLIHSDGSRARMRGGRRTSTAALVHRPYRAAAGMSLAPLVLWIRHVRPLAAEDLQLSLAAAGCAQGGPQVSLDVKRFDDAVPAGVGPHRADPVAAVVRRIDQTVAPTVGADQADEFAAVVVDRDDSVSAIVHPQSDRRSPPLVDDLQFAKPLDPRSVPVGRVGL